ncbi:LysR substrate-binding domain-containing protein [Sphingomonas psychrotolerans]|uniref:LysR substrate-binding domain-containing protein n=1 Tax=Sphingomonas psychrotolerans TaxID=1327635 RepID=A0ABU3MZH7_9SPHN|nr:LysR substrate-binding domain-containing protein [Sphingomonas psychrotolerans]MDT8757699.1 LysR substrate-binding domain-containing protein [Sphingomonas psychrotolerans]
MLGRSFPSLIAIRAFEAAARLGSFTRAGEELGTSSASVSYHVRRLEAQLGVTLFRRHPHRVELSEAGALVAAETVRAFDGLRASFARAVDLEEGRLSLTTLPTFGTSWLAPRLGHFRGRHPDIAVELDVSEAAEDLSAGRFDAAVRNGDGQWPGLRTIELFPSIFMPLCVPELRDAAAQLGRPRAVLPAPLLGRQDWWGMWYAKLGLPGGLPAANFGTTLSAEHLDVAAALAGHGIVIASPILFGAEIAAGRLVPAHDMVAAAGRSFWLVYPVSRQRSRKIAAFRDWIVEAADAARRDGAAFIDRANRSA